MTQIWNPDLYRQELLELIKRAVDQFATQHPAFCVYTVTVYTGVNGAASHVSFDDFENSKEAARKLQEYFPDMEFERNWNAAEFRHLDFARIKHSSLPENFEFEVDQDTLEQFKAVGVDAVKSAIPMVKKLKRHTDARLAAAIYDDDADDDWPI